MLDAAEGLYVRCQACRSGFSIDHSGGGLTSKIWLGRRVGEWSPESIMVGEAKVMMVIGGAMDIDIFSDSGLGLGRIVGSYLFPLFVLAMIIYGIRRQIRIRRFRAERAERGVPQRKSK
ncbi:hypothetical protein [Micromonospora sp. DT229]|uniref:hypothetical protein n=1 Tax=Micromonospora sp. DT229 TaxID=3393430 RepID=UPI003CF38170